jgi:hypothetical protein
LPEAVVRMQNGKLAVTYGNLAGLLVENIHQLDERLTLIEKHLNILPVAE